MSTLLNDDERALRDIVRSFLDKKVAPDVAAHERAKTFPWELLGQLYEFGYVRGVLAHDAERPGNGGAHAGQRGRSGPGGPFPRPPPRGTTLRLVRPDRVRCR